ncbi:MAG: methyl-accepting chemotaxis protein [Clostridiales bacterium]|jgi:methyl-accepting chemotaxis protein|nr:methyl-accepting chemotaxis protein [Clostridiales bacterium]
MRKKNILLYALILATVNGIIFYLTLTFQYHTKFSTPIVALIIGIIIFVLSTFLLWIANRRVSSLMENVNENLDSLSEGNFTALAAKEAAHANFGKTSTLFEKLRKMFSQWMTDLLYSAVAVKVSSEKINTSTAQTFDSIQVLNHSLNDIRKIFEETTHMLSNISALTVDLAQSSTTIADHSNEAVEKMHGASDTAQSGGAAVTQVVGAMKRINEDVKNAQAMIIKLESASSEIGNITETIAAISEQTNLLALNAAIEAARAGEYGRGFAVVADEVRKLADESHHAAQKIDKLISSMQVDVTDVVNSIQKVHDEVDEGVGVAENAGDSLANIISAVSLAETLIGNISKDVKFQSDNTSSISASIQEITSQAETGTASVEEITSVVETQLDFLAQNNQSAADLLKIAGNLDKTMAVFDSNIGEQMLTVCEKIAKRLPLSNEALISLAQTVGLTEIHIIDRNGFIKFSSNQAIIGFQFSSEPGSQTYDFMQIFKNPSRRVNQKSDFRDVDDKLFKYAGIITNDHQYVVQCGLEASDFMHFKGENALS